MVGSTCFHLFSSYSLTVTFPSLVISATPPFFVFEEHPLSLPLLYHDILLLKALTNSRSEEVRSWRKMSDILYSGRVSPPRGRVSPPRDRVSPPRFLNVFYFFSWVFYFFPLRLFLRFASLTSLRQDSIRNRARKVDVWPNKVCERTIDCGKKDRRFLSLH